MHADRIFVLHGRTVVQRGTYTELMQQDGLFATLARRQVASIAGDCRGCIKANSANASRRFV